MTFLGTFIVPLGQTERVKSYLIMFGNLFTIALVEPQGTTII